MTPKKQAKKLESLTGNAVAHGTDNAYSNYGCRCDPCKAAHAAVHAEYRKRLRAKNA